MAAAITQNVIFRGKFPEQRNKRSPIRRIGPKSMFVIIVAMSVIEMAVNEKDDREVHEVGKVVTKEWSKAKVLKLKFVIAF